MFGINADNESHITISGRFSAANTAEAEKVLGFVNTNCSVDLKNLEYISSAGIGTLLRTYVRLKESGYSFKLLNMNTHISEVIRYSGLDKVFIIE